MTKSRLVLRSFLVLLACLTARELCAQMDTGAVLGAVKDQSGAVVPSAAVTLTSEGAALSASTTSGPDGSYIFTPVRIGTYSVRCEAKGFKKMNQLHVTVDVQQRVVVDFTLLPGTVSETVEVTAPTPLLQAHDASVGQVVTQQQITDLPLNGRNYTFLAQVSAGVTESQADTRGFNASGSFSANGQRARRNNYILDGIDNNNVQPANSAGTDYVVLTPVDALQEFKIQTGDYSAEFGRAAGAVINATVKSGTNAFHGDVWEFLRNDKLDAPDFFEMRMPSRRVNIARVSLAARSVARCEFPTSITERIKPFSSSHTRVRGFAKPSRLQAVCRLAPSTTAASPIC